MRKVNAYGRGDIAAQDLAGVGAERARRTRGDSVATGRADVWRISDLRASTRYGINIPADIGRRLWAHDRARKSDTRNPAPNDSLWHEDAAYLAPRVTLADGAWSGQKWHTVTVPGVDAPAPIPDGAHRVLGEPGRYSYGYRTNAAVGTVAPYTNRERVADLAYLAHRVRVARARRILGARRRMVSAARRAGALA